MAESTTDVSRRAARRAAGVSAVDPAPTTTTLELRGVCRRYRQGDAEVVALDDVHLLVERGELLAVVGPSGSGKSTLLHVAGGLDEVDSGTVLVHGVDLRGLRAAGRAQMRRRSIGFVFQFFQLLPALTVEENVALPLLFDRRRDAYDRARAILQDVGLGAKGVRLPAELSGGEMQRVAIARALVTDPPLILADEPTGNLDSATGEHVLDLLVSAVRLRGASLVLVTHDDRAAGRADRILTMRDGRLGTS